MVRSAGVWRVAGGDRRRLVRLGHGPAGTHRLTNDRSKPHRLADGRANGDHQSCSKLDSDVQPHSDGQSDVHASRHYHADSATEPNAIHHTDANV